MNKIFLFLLTFFGTCLFASSPKTASTPSPTNEKQKAEILATVHIQDLHTDYSVTLANGFKLEVIKGKRVRLPGEYVDPSGICYDKNACGKDFGQAHFLLSLAKQEAIRQKYHMLKLATNWRILQGNIVEKVE